MRKRASGARQRTAASVGSNAQLTRSATDGPGDPSVSVDLLIRALLALGVNRRQVGRAIGAAASA